MMAFNEEERNKFTNIYQQHCDYLLRYAMYLLHSTGDAESAVQETFIRALKNLNKISEKECRKTRAFLVRTLERISFTMIKENANRNWEEYDDNFQSDFKNEDSIGDIVWKEFDINTIRSITKKLIEELSEMDRNILTYQIIDELTYAEIAKELGITEKNVSVKLTRMRKKLRDEFLRRRDDRK